MVGPEAEKQYLKCRPKCRGKKKKRERPKRPGKDKKDKSAWGGGGLKGEWEKIGVRENRGR